MIPGMNKKQMKEFIKALDAIVSEKGIDRNVVIEAFEQAVQEELQ